MTFWTEIMGFEVSDPLPVQAGDRPVTGGALALDVRPELGPGPESVFLGQDELGVAEQEPLGGPVTQHLGRPVLSGLITGFVRAQQVRVLALSRVAA